MRRPAKIAQHYLKTWFTIDLCSSVPIDQIVTVASGSSSSALRLNKMIRLVRMVKLLRIVRLMRMSKSSEIGHVIANMNPSTVRMCVVIFVMVSSYHFLACLYWMTVEIEWLGLQEGAGSCSSAETGEGCDELYDEVLHPST